MDLSAFVLAGGQSVRMGQDKAELPWHGRTLLEHMVELLRTIANPVLVVGRTQLPDRLPGLGPLSGIATGLEASLTDANLFVAVDLPLLTNDFLIYLRHRLESTGCPILACKIGSGFPLCLGVRRSLLPDIQRRLNDGELSIRRFIEAGNAEIISELDFRNAGFDAAIFTNINTPDDYRNSL